MQGSSLASEHREADMTQDALYQSFANSVGGEASNN